MSATRKLAAATARVEKMLNAAPFVGIDLFDLELIRRRLIDREAERARAVEGVAG
jgi:hypothetical protein